MQGRGANSIFDPKNKWLMINQLMREDKIGVIALQETHLIEDQRSQLESLHHHIRIFASSDPDRPNSKGVAVALNKRLLATNEARAQEIIPGRAILVEIPWHNQEPIQILNIYAPNDPSENAQFWRDLDNRWAENESTLPFPDILLGDFNMCEDHMDRINHRVEDRRITDAFNCLKITLGLNDGWRHQNPTEILYTLTHRANNGHLSRLDRIYLTPALINRTEEWTHSQPPITTDHKLVTTKIVHQNSPYIGKGRWEIPPHVLLNHTFIQESESLGIQMLNDMQTLESIPNLRSQEMNAQSIATNFKQEILKLAKRMAKKPIHPLEKRLKNLELNIKLISNDPTIEHEEKLLSLMLLEEERREVTARSFITRRLACTAKHRLEGETISKYWVNLNKEKKPRDTILKLRDSTNPPRENQPSNLTNRSEEMAKVAVNYHENIQNRDLDVNETNRAEAIQRARASIENRLDPIQKEELRVNLDKLDIEIALASAANGKASGLNGIPYEFWKIMKTRHNTLTILEEPSFDVINFLQILFNDIENHGLENNSHFNDGWLCPIYKKGDKTEIANYRPITVLNTDYKLITKALQSRLARVAPTLIHENQAGFMKNRSITDHIKTIRIMSEYAEISENLEGAIIALDQEKAYDRIRHDYLWEIMEEMNFPESFVKTTQTLYKNAKTKVMINGVQSEFFEITRGVRQGDPLSCLLFNLAIEPLANSIRNSEIEGFEIPKSTQRLKILLFADDTTIFLKNSDSLDALNNALNTWCLASGAKFNKSKTEIIPLGKRPFREKVRNTRSLLRPEEAIPIDTHILEEGKTVRILGASVGDNSRDDQAWAKVTEKIVTQLSHWNKANPTVEGRRLSAQMYIGRISQFLAKAQGMPTTVEKAIEKLTKKYIWNSDKAKISLERLNPSHEKGGRKILDIKARNKAISATNIKTYLRTDDQRPTWTFIYDEFIRRAYDKNSNKYGDNDPRINPIIQKWPQPNNMRSLPREVKTLLSALKTLSVRLDCKFASNRAKAQVPIWFHPKLKDDSKPDNNSKKSKHLRSAHRIMNVGETIHLANTLTYTTHEGNNRCKCAKCLNIKTNNDCRTPHTCALHALKLLGKVDPDWIPSRPDTETNATPNATLTNEASTLDQCIRILTKDCDSKTATVANPTNEGCQRVLTIFTDGSCDKNGQKDAKAGSGIYYGPNDHRNIAVRVPPNYNQSNQSAELYAIKTAVETSELSSIIEIRTDSQYSIDALTKHTKTWEDIGWIGIKNGNLIKDTLNTLRAHRAPIKFTWVKGHSGIEGNEGADALAKEATLLEPIQGPTTLVPNTIPPGAKLSSITQALIYKELIERKQTATEHSTALNIERIQTDISLSQDHSPPEKSIWLNLQKTKNVFRTQREFLFKTIKGAQMIGKRWTHIPNYEHRAICQVCDATEDMEHILTKCNIPGQSMAWQTMGEIWENKFPGEWTRPSYGEILGCASAKLTTNGKHNKGKTRLFQILVSEVAYIIWTLRCTRVIEHDNDQSKWPKPKQIRNTIKFKLDTRLRMDCLHTNSRTFKNKALRQSIVKKTWAGLLENERDLPDDWPRKEGVLVGIWLSQPPPEDHG